MGGGAFFSTRADPKDMLPTLPQNIRKIIIIFDKFSRSRVIPVDIPTVPIAEKHSKLRSLKDKFGCKQLMRKTPRSVRVKFTKNTLTAFLIHSSGSLLPKTLVERSLRMMLSEKRSKTATVVVLIPPAVDPGEPPMNIRISVKRIPPFEREAVSVIFIPAVLGETESKKLLKT